ARDAQMAIAVDARPVAALHQPDHARLAANAMLALRLAERQELAPGEYQRLRLVENEIVERAVDDCGDVAAEQRAARGGGPAGGGVGLDDDAGVVEEQHRIGGVEEDRAELPLALEEGQLRFDRRGDVEEEAAELGERAGGIELADHGLDHVHERAVAATQAAA